jgi:hypothetical protein
MESLEEKVARLEAELEKKDGPIRCKVSPKGGISVYGVGRFPTTLYRQQWEKVLNAADEIRKFIEDNDANLPLRPDDWKAQQAALRAAAEKGQ